ncbi:hypothetical protein PGB90_008152 [Kerria lacca]
MNEKPILNNAYNNAIVAKNIQVSNQKHHILFDSTTNRSFWPLQLEKQVSEVANTKTIGSKIYRSPGSTQCSKIKIFRTRTTDSSKKSKLSPHKSLKFENRLRLKTNNKSLSEMDLAIYWDNESVSLEETSNINAATIPIATIDSIPNNYRTFSLGMNSNNDQIFQKPYIQTISTQPLLITERYMKDKSNKEKKMTYDTVQFKKNCNSNKNINRNKKTDYLFSNKPNIENKTINFPIQVTKNIKTKANSKYLKNVESCKVIDVTTLKKSIGSSTNLMLSQKTNNITTMPAITTTATAATRTSGKTVPNEITLNKTKHVEISKSNNVNNLKMKDEVFKRLENSRNLRIPKPKKPFVKKNYFISTLVPPFSIWPETTGLEYPDHWRLHSVYQHSYKPFENRKTSFMKFIFQ